MYSKDEVELQIPPDKISYTTLFSQLFFNVSLRIVLSAETKLIYSKDEMEE